MHILKVRIPRMLSTVQKQNMQSSVHFADILW